MEVIRVNVSDYDEELRKAIRYKIVYLSKEISKLDEQKGFLEVHIKTGCVDEWTVKVMRIVKECEESYREFHPDILFQNDPVHNYPKYNVYDELINRGWVVEYENGLIGFGNKFLEVFEYLDQIFIEWSKKYKADQYTYPDLISIETLNKYKYLSQFPNHIMFSTHLKEDIEIISDFSRKIINDNNCLNDHFLDKPLLVNKSAICTHVYDQYKNKTIDLESPIVITSIGKCKRYESINMTKIERLLDFSMREIVLVGSSEFVLETREEFIELSKSLIRQLGLKANIKTGNDPFFTNEYTPKALMQKKFKMKYELNAFLPYNEMELSVGSFNYHGSYFTDAFNIKSACGKHVNTGCIAFGLERFVYAYLCQIGLDNIPILK